VDLVDLVFVSFFICYGWRKKEEAQAQNQQPRWIFELIKHGQFFLARMISVDCLFKVKQPALVDLQNP
jgi:hypothetical protein